MRKSWVLAACLVACAAHAATISKPEVTLTLPDGWVEVPANVLQDFFVEMQRQAPNAQIPRYDYAFQSAGGPPWLEYPYVLVKITATKRPTERELETLPTLDLNDKIRDKRDDWSALMKDSSLGKMRYDKAANVVWITSKSTVVNAGEVSGISGVIPTENGFLELHAYAKTQEFPEHLPTFEKIITGAKISPVLAYRPRWTDQLPAPVGGFDWKTLGWVAALGAVIGVF